MHDLIKATGLCKSFGDELALDHVDITVPAGTVIGFIGSNGAGKTTTIRALLGLAPLDAGDVVLFGEPFGAHADAATSKRIKERIGVVLDSCPFVGDLTLKTVGGVMKTAYPAWSDERYRGYLGQFGLDQRKKVGELSRGMGMKLQLACALSHDPDLLILDEATAGLDPLAREEILDELRAFMRDDAHGILLSSHITSDLEKVADRIVCIDKGRIVFDRDKDALVDEAGIVRCRSAELELIASSGLVQPGQLRFIRHAYGIDALVPDRFALAARFPDIVCDKASIDDYLQLVLKGEAR